jgi:hypothetical protein
LAETFEIAAWFTPTNQMKGSEAGTPWKPAEMPVMTKLAETPATLTAQPPALGALIAHGPMT